MRRVHRPSTRARRGSPHRHSPCSPRSTRELFDEPLPDLWYDEKNVTLERQIASPRAGTFTVRDEGEMVELLNSKGEPVFAVELLAPAALAFIAGTGTFFVRELPGELRDEQRIALVSTLVEHKLLDLVG